MTTSLPGHKRRLALPAQGDPAHLPFRERKARRVWRVFTSQVLLQFFHAHADVGEDPAECSFGDIAALVYRDRRAASIRVPHDVVAASDAGHLETGPL